MTKSCGVRETRKKERSVEKSKWTFVSRQYREREMELSLNGSVCEDLTVEVSQREMIVYLLLMRVCNCVHAHCWGLLIAGIYIYIKKNNVSFANCCLFHVNLNVITLLTTTCRNHFCKIYILILCRDYTAAE